MSGVQQVFFVIGVFTSVVGALAIIGLMAWQGLEWWVKANDMRSILTKFYIDKLRQERDRHPG